MIHITDTQPIFAPRTISVRRWASTICNIVILTLGWMTFTHTIPKSNAQNTETKATAAQATAPSDADITSAVNDELLFDEAVISNGIQVETNSGIVTLKGMTSNILAKDRAAELAKTVRGVRSVINLIEVEPATPPTASDLEKHVASALLRDPATDRYEVQVSAADSGQITLTGTVDSWQEKELASVVAKGEYGVTSVVNEIDINFPTDRPDSEIKPEIESRLDWDTLVDDALINTEVKNGKVTLTGVVGSASEKTQAMLDAWVDGVKNVDDSGLRVERWARDKDLRTDKYATRDDGDIASAITDAFIYDPRVFSFAVESDVTKGWVTLKGTVDNAKARQAAEQVARNTVGVVGVTNSIEVITGTELTDAEIENNVVAGLAHDPWVESFDIAVEVKEGTAQLRGAVDSWFEKARVETITYGARGVTSVENHLEVSNPESVLIFDPYIWHLHPVPWHFHPTVSARGVIGEQAPDTEITDAIESELMWSPFVDEDQVTVTVVDGVATLTGTVDSTKEKDAASENAWEGGAIRVVNELKVGDQG